MDGIMSCRKCELCRNQLPLLDCIKCVDVMWVGLSAKRVDCVGKCIPLSMDTKSGKIIGLIEEQLDCSCYKTNLVKCLPLDDGGRLRYPTISEKNKCYDNLTKEISVVEPRVVVLLGRVVSEFVLGRHGVEKVELSDDFDYTVFNFAGVSFVAVHHPSYISVYKRKRIKDYVSGIVEVIRE